MVTSLHVYAGSNQCLFVCLFFAGKNIEVIGRHLKNYVFQWYNIHSNLHTIRIYMILVLKMEYFESYILEETYREKNIEDVKQRD